MAIFKIDRKISDVRMDMNYENQNTVMQMPQ